MGSNPGKNMSGPDKPANITQVNTIDTSNANLPKKVASFGTDLNHCGYNHYRT